MVRKLSRDALADDKVRRLSEISGQDFADCYQCGKCTAGCPMSYDMDYVPNRILRLGQLGRGDDIISSRTVWVCVSCETCTTRCPKEIDIARIMDAGRQLALEEGTRPEGREIRDLVRFHRAFLGQVKKYGRLFEFGMVRSYKLASGHFMQDAMNAPKLLARGKLSFTAGHSKIGGRDEVRRIFEKCGM
jgi:heterodisulfide reductase subunit C